MKKKIEVWGTGNVETRDFLYADDLVNFIKIAINKQKTHTVINCGSGIPIKVKDLVKKIIKKFSKKI